MVLLPERRAVKRHAKERRVRDANANPRNPNPAPIVRKPDPVPNLRNSHSDRVPRVRPGPIREPNSDQPRDTDAHSLSDPDRDCPDRQIEWDGRRTHK